MRRFIESEDRRQVTLMPECLDDYIGEDNPVRVVDAFVGELDLHALGFQGVEPAATGRPSYHPSVLLKLYIYGYLNRIQSSRRLEREAQRNVALDTIEDVNASGLWPGKVVTEVKPAGHFWEAEPEHQDYLQRYPEGYTCHWVRPGWKLPRRSSEKAA